MSLGIEIAGEKLELAPGTVLEIESANPFLQFNEQNLLGEYSLPFQVIANAKNNRLLGYAGVGQQRVTNAAVDAILYDKSLQVGTGSVKKEKVNVHLNRVSKGTISCYYLSKASGFWQQIKDMKLREINVGGDRSFAWEGLSTITDGFWKHIHQVAAGAVGAYDYAIFPVINYGWSEGEYTPPLMNKVYYDAMQAFPVTFPNTYGAEHGFRMNRIVPFPYLKYVLTKAFEHAGWTVSGDILDDADFQKIVMINFKAIDYGYKTFPGPDYVYRDPVVFNLQDNLPDISLSAFLIALKNRFGWYYDFDNTAKKCTIRMLRDLVNEAPTDKTAYSSPLIFKTILQDNPLYALRNNDGNGALNFDGADVQSPVDKKTDLPSPDENKYGHVRLVIEENNYYICQQNEDTEAWEWVLLDYNIYDYEPDGFTEEITTDALIVGNEYFDDYLDFIPRIDNPGISNFPSGDEVTWGIHLAFYYGQRDNKAGDPVPYASHHIYDSQGYTLSAWSLAFKALKTDDTEAGLYDLNWKPFLDMLNSPEEVEHTLYLPLHEYLQLQFSDRIVVDGIELFIKQIKAKVPYDGVVNCVSVRV